MRKIAFAVILLVSYSAFAKSGGCLAELGSPATEKAFADTNRLKLTNEQIEFLILAATEKFDLREKCVTDEVMIFPEESDKPYLGYRMKMKRASNGAAVVDRIFEADLWEQRQYFERLAKCEGIQPIAAPLAEPLLNSNRLEVPDYVQAKLRDKHDLVVEDVLAALSHRNSEPQYLFVDRMGLNRHKLVVTTERGREMRIVLGQDPHTHGVSLISAY